MVHEVEAEPNGRMKLFQPQTLCLAGAALVLGILAGACVTYWQAV